MQEILDIFFVMSRCTLKSVHQLASVFTLPLVRKVKVLYTVYFSLRIGLSRKRRGEVHLYPLQVG
jgi:hypothetical protein